MIVVTGGSGFIGKVLIERIQQRTKERVLCVDFRPHRRAETMHPDAFLHKMVNPQFAKSVSIVFHNGAIADTTNKDVHQLMATNFDYSTVLLRRCMDTNTRIIYASSASVYGFSTHNEFHETDEMQPQNLYARTKSLFDRYASTFMDYHSQIVGLRYFNVYGRYENHKGRMASVIHKFFQQKKDGNIYLFEKSHLYRRDFIHVDDIVDINFFFWENPELSGIYNAGTGQARSFQEIGDIFSKRYGATVKHIPMPTPLQAQYQEYTCADMSCLNRKYNKEYLPLEEGVNRYLKFLESQ